MGRLDGKIAIVTGGAAGIGRAAVELFAREGAAVAILDISHSGEEASVRAVSAGARAMFRRTDVTDPAEVEAAIGAVQEWGGKIDILYNNAGASTRGDGTVVKASVEEFHKVIGLNLFSTWLCCKFAIPYMQAGGGGAIVNTASAAGLMGTNNLDCYTAAKGGVIALTRSLAVNYAPNGIRVNAVAPTSTTTDRVLALYQNRPPSGLREKNLLGSASPEDVAYAALYLASDEARVVTGHTLPVDSGVTIS